MNEQLITDPAQLAAEESMRTHAAAQQELSMDPMLEYAADLTPTAPEATPISVTDASASQDRLSVRILRGTADSLEGRRTTSEYVSDKSKQVASKVGDSAKLAKDTALQATFLSRDIARAGVDKSADVADKTGGILTSKLSEKLADRRANAAVRKDARITARAEKKELKARQKQERSELNDQDQIYGQDKKMYKSMFKDIARKERADKATARIDAREAKRLATIEKRDTNRKERADTRQKRQDQEAAFQTYVPNFKATQQRERAEKWDPRKERVSRIGKLALLRGAVAASSVLAGAEKVENGVRKSIEVVGDTAQATAVNVRRGKQSAERRVADARINHEQNQVSRHNRLAKKHASKLVSPVPEVN